MTNVGRNMRLSVDQKFRSQTRAFYEGVLGCSVKTPMPDLEVYTFTNGANIEVYFVEPSEALTPQQHMPAAWIEFEVDDEDAVARALAAMRIEPFDYFDKTHRYFQAPGGQVFRLASRQTAT